MRNTILVLITYVCFIGFGVFIVTLICDIINIIKFKNKCKKCKSSSDQTIENLTIEATNDKQYIDNALLDCNKFINFINNCEKQNVLSKEVNIIDESIHQYRLMMTFNVDPDLQEIDFNEYAEKYNYNNSLVKTCSLKELLMIQTFALKFFDYMFPKRTLYSKNGRDGICKIEFIHENTNKCILIIEYFYGTESVRHNYPILDGYYFGCMVGSQILVDKLIPMVDEIERITDIGSLSSSLVKEHIKRVLTKMKIELNIRKFPRFKD